MDNVLKLIHNLFQLYTFQLQDNILTLAEMASMPKNEVISNILEFEKKKSDIESK